MVKREEEVDAFRKGKFELPALTVRKMNGNEEISWFRVNGIIAGVQEIEIARKGVGRFDEWCVAQCCG